MVPFCLLSLPALIAAFFLPETITKASIKEFREIN
jgi:hypothetical protein